MSRKAEKEVREGLPPLMPRLWRYALVLTRKRDVADDLSQSAALRALDKAHQFQAGTKLDAWVFTIQSSLWRNMLRSDKVRRGAGLVPVEEAGIQDPAPDVETNILARQVLNNVMDLPEAQRDTVFLTYVEGYSYKETAAILDIPVGTVMSRLAAGRRKVNETLALDTSSDAGKRG
ncbi:MAG: RNA polymerase sigma-70 factor (ECF subfamily) [Paracoccaceae bacterium]